MMIVQDHTAAELYDRCMGNFERLYQEGDQRPGDGDRRALYISGTPFRIKYFEQVLDEISKHDDVALWTDGQVAD